MELWISIACVIISVAMINIITRKLREIRDDYQDYFQNDVQRYIDYH